MDHYFTPRGRLFRGNKISEMIIIWFTKQIESPQGVESDHQAVAKIAIQKIKHLQNNALISSIRITMALFKPPKMNIITNSNLVFY
jgi:hypothetical protein